MLIDRLHAGIPAGSHQRASGDSVIGWYKTEVLRRCGPCRNIEAVELGTLEWVDWLNSIRLLEPLGWVSPAEHEGAFYQRQAKPATAA